MKYSILLQSLALIGAVVTIVQAAPTPTQGPDKRTMLDLLIGETVLLMEEYSKEKLAEKVADPSLQANHCRRCFFVGAEKSLEMIHFNNTRVYDYVQKYNDATKTEKNCTKYELDMKKTCTLGHLFKNIIECAKNEL